MRFRIGGRRRRRCCREDTRTNIHPDRCGGDTTGARSIRGEKERWGESRNTAEGGKENGRDRRHRRADRSAPWRRSAGPRAVMIGGDLPKDFVKRVDSEESILNNNFRSTPSWNVFLGQVMKTRGENKTVLKVMPTKNRPYLRYCSPPGVLACGSRAMITELLSDTTQQRAQPLAW